MEVEGNGKVMNSLKSRRQMRPLLFKGLCSDSYRSWFCSFPGPGILAWGHDTGWGAKLWKWKAWSESENKKSTEEALGISGWHHVKDTRKKEVSPCPLSHTGSMPDIGITILGSQEMLSMDRSSNNQTLQPCFPHLSKTLGGLWTVCLGTGGWGGWSERTPSRCRITCLREYSKQRDLRSNQSQSEFNN